MLSWNSIVGAAIAIQTCVTTGSRNNASRFTIADGVSFQAVDMTSVIHCRSQCCQQLTLFRRWREDMWRLIALLSCFSSSWGISRGGFPSASNAMLGEQVDLTGAVNIPDWMRVVGAVANNAASADSIDSRQPPVNTIDREPLDEVERIEPMQWPGRADILPFTTETSWPRSFATQSTTSAQRNPSTQRYPTITAPPPTVTVDEVFCDFGPSASMPLCEWQNGNGALDWTAGTGMGTNWLGGPAADATSGTMEGGYAFLETSRIPSKEPRFRSPGGLLHSPQLGSTGVSGTCFMFKYAMDGLSIAGLRVLLHVGTDEFSFKKEQTEQSPAENVTVTSCEPLAEISEERVIWHAQYYTLGLWQQAQILYTYPQLHSVVIEGVPVESTDPSRLYRGYIAIDDIDLQPGTSCVGSCNFAGGFCDWNNDAEDDFDWTISRGSGSPTTGPAMDSSSDRATAGGYAFIDSNFPRRPGDRAKLVSPTLPATNADAPMCMRFWFHMFGSGIGRLTLSLRRLRSSDTDPPQQVWSLSGNAGNAWFMSQLTVSSLEEFQLVFEASVGNSGMGDIAIDDISYGQGACPVSPQVASPTPRDCTFEVDECEWINSRGPDRVEWERVSTQALSPRNQRKPYSNGQTISRRNEYFLGLGRLRGGARSSGGGTAQLVSREMKGSDEPVCVTFWYSMFEPFIDSAGPSLGVLRLYVQAIGDTSTEAKPIWQLYNNQGPTWVYAQARINEKRNFNILLEGTWGPNRASGSIAVDDISFYTGNCSVKPPSATVRAEDCSFEKGLCGWENSTLTANDRTVTWQRALSTHRPAQLLDRTFGSGGDFVFFDIFTTENQPTKVRLRSPVIHASPDEEMMCFSFWFAAFGVEESTTLRVIGMPVEGDGGGEDGGGSVGASVGEGEGDGQREQPLWSLTAKGLNDPRPVWMAAQVTIEARTAYRLVLEGSASNGGFAIDDIKFQSMGCAIRPSAARPLSTGEGT